MQVRERRGNTRGWTTAIYKRAPRRADRGSLPGRRARSPHCWVGGARDAAAAAERKDSGLNRRFDDVVNLQLALARRRPVSDDGGPAGTDRAPSVSVSPTVRHSLHAPRSPTPAVT